MTSATAVTQESQMVPAHRFELDLENNGNPLALQLGSLMRLRRRAAAFVGKATEALKRRLEDFHAL
jgi:hypothetical protein